MPQVLNLCPSCEMEIDYLECVEDVRGVRYGTVDLNGDNYEYYDEETTDVDFVCYKCPECGYETTSTGEFEVELSDEEFEEWEERVMGPRPKTPPKPILTFFNKEAVDDI